MDADLESIQQARDAARRARNAQQSLSVLSQQQVDRIVKAMAEAAKEAARPLARLAAEETGIGVAEDKVKKNLFAAQNVYEAIKSMKTVGVVSEEPQRGIVEIAEPVGVICGIVPVTNPTSTVIYKSLIAIKARNAVVFSPHPQAVKCSAAAAEALEKAAVRAGAPPDSIQCLRLATREATSELMKHPDVALILATGGSAMVKAAYSAGKPAYGVGPGNVPAFIERTADVAKAVDMILESKTFDNGTICASEQSIVVESAVRDHVIRYLSMRGGYFLNDEQTSAVSRVVMQSRGDGPAEGQLGVNPKVVGRSARTIAEMAGISVPASTRVLVAPLAGVGKSYPLSAEKLCPVLGFYVEPDWQAACERCIQILQFGGMGHTLVIHSNNRRVIMEFALKKPVFRILVNTPSSQGAIGLTTGLLPALTLGCGTWGGNITSDNVGPRHLMNLKRLAYGGYPAGAGAGAVGDGASGFRSADQAAGAERQPVGYPVGVGRRSVDYSEIVAAVDRFTRGGGGGA